MSEYFGFITEGGGLRPEDRIWGWALLVLLCAALAALLAYARYGLPRRRRRRRSR